MGMVGVIKVIMIEIMGHFGIACGDLHLWMEMELSQ